MNGGQGLALIVLEMQEIVREIEGGSMMNGLGVIGERERDAKIVDMGGGIGDTQSAVT